VWNEFRLASGRRVRLDSLYITRTYAGLLEGVPDDQYNLRQIERAARALIPVWGERATYVIPPQIRAVTEVGRTYNRLPELIYCAWLTSEPIKPQWCASELVTVWFGPPEADIPVLQLVVGAVGGVPWEQVAKDFDY